MREMGPEPSFRDRKLASCMTSRITLPLSSTRGVTSRMAPVSRIWIVLMIGVSETSVPCEAG